MSRLEHEGLGRVSQFSSARVNDGDRPQSSATEAHDRELLEWAAQISTRANDTLRTVQLNDAEEHEAQRNAEQFAQELLEGNWDPSKHPRLGGPPNAGWWATTGGPSTIRGTGASPGMVASLRTAGSSRTASYRADRSMALAMNPSSISTDTSADAQTVSPNRLSRTKTTAKSGVGGDGPANAGRLSENDVLNYFRLIYGGQGERLLRAFARSGGLLKIESPWFGKSALDTRNVWRPQQIRVHRDLSPVEAAKELMDRLIDAIGLTEVRQHLDHTGFSNIETLIASYKQSVRQAAAAVALASELYLSGISIVNEGADWVITIHDLSEGNYYAAIGLLPLLPASVGKTGVVLKHGRQTMRISAEAVRGVKALPVGELIELLESTRKLARNMEKTGVARPAGTAAHHIVPAGLKKFRSAGQARAILRRFGISVENAANGVYLPSNFDDAVKAAYHGTLHSKQYFDEVLRRLQLARSKEDALIILNTIRKELLAGTFPH